MPTRTKTRRTRRTTRRPKVPLATKKYVRRLLPKVELKRIVSYQDEVSNSTLVQGSSLPMIAIPQGLQVWNRIGNEVKIKGFHIKGILNNNATTPNYVRMVLAWAPMDTVVTLNGSNLFADTDLAGNTGGVTSIPGLNIMYFPINRTQYTPVFDKVFKLGGSGDPSCTRMFSKFIRMNKTLKFIANNTGTGVQSAQLSLWYLVAEAGDDTTGGQAIEINHVARTYFTDA